MTCLCHFLVAGACLSCHHRAKTSFLTGSRLPSILCQSCPWYMDNYWLGYYPCNNGRKI